MARGVDAVVAVGGDGHGPPGAAGASPGPRRRWASSRPAPATTSPRALGLARARPGSAAADVIARRRRARRSTRPASGRQRWFAGVLSSGFDSTVNERANRMRWPRGRSPLQRRDRRRAAGLPRRAVHDHDRRRGHGARGDAGRRRQRHVLRRRDEGLPRRPPRRRAAARHGARQARQASSSCGSSRRVYKGTHVDAPGRRRCTSAARCGSSAPGAIAYADGERVGPAAGDVRPACQGRCASWCRAITLALRHALSRGALRRFAAAARRRCHAPEPRSARRYDFALDPFQVQACQALEDGHGVLVAAPTGCRQDGRRRVRGAPRARRGTQVLLHDADQGAVEPEVRRPRARATAPRRVGLLTGDNSVNGEAPVVVMTTEVLRNMLYAGSHDARRTSATS